MADFTAAGGRNPDLSKIGNLRTKAKAKARRVGLRSQLLVQANCRGEETEKVSEVGVYIYSRRSVERKESPSYLKVSLEDGGRLVGGTF